MSRFLPLVAFVLWLSASPSPAAEGLSLWQGAGILLAGYLLLVAGMAIWSRMVARKIYQGNSSRRLWRFNWVMFAARVLAAGWLAVGIYLLGWGMLVDKWLDVLGLGRLPVDSPGLVLGTFPCFAAWLGLLWAQFPTDHAQWEQNLLISLDQNFPVHRAPGLGGYLNINLRLKVLFAAAPAFAFFVMKDFLVLATWRWTWLREHPGMWGAVTMLPPFLFVLVAGSEIIRRVLLTQSMPDSPLRRRLEEICRRNRIGIRDVLLWHTRHQMGNAAVIGLVPRVRYILMSDLLVETLSDEQIEAVFAHEMGHVRYRHLFWLVAALYGLVVAMAGPGQYVADFLGRGLGHIGLSDSAQIGVLGLLGYAIGAAIFGYVSRRFESQADVFAARTIQESAPQLVLPSGEMDMITLERPGSYVGHYGAQTVAGALHRVAAINNIPVAARSWSHGSIAHRMRFLMRMGDDPNSTARFDRLMLKIYFALVIGLLALSAWLAIGILQGRVILTDYL